MRMGWGRMLSVRRLTLCGQPKEQLLLVGQLSDETLEAAFTAFNSLDLRIA